ncbi:hypothetical protein CYMTET_22413 [Cymbomonas tetramitiformis]|uniref:Uncharacterized protein n=1 Tax=Cymbomonas tetramitiformis TaxID=36881 RepID=A0AAE0G095_9CHLO|nr:hypothetical protein CYMTET_22413 [Cymbomonas tetramitiformis]
MRPSATVPDGAGESEGPGRKGLRVRPTRPGIERMHRDLCLNQRRADAVLLETDPTRRLLITATPVERLRVLMTQSCGEEHLVKRAVSREETPERGSGSGRGAASCRGDVAGRKASVTQTDTGNVDDLRRIDKAPTDDDKAYK